MTMKKYLKKRIIPAGLSLILIIMTVISIMPINVSAEDSLNVIEISRVNELIEFANKCKYDSYSKDKIVKLTADIDVFLQAGMNNGQAGHVKLFQPDTMQSPQVRQLRVRSVFPDKLEG